MSDHERAIFRSAILSIRFAVQAIAGVTAQAERAIDLALMALDRDSPQPPGGH